MLGIGFIITHFVAMQKPQQRKYHSSCDRSVHRGTAHGKQRVKVCKRKTPHLFWCGVFCPLTGMVLKQRRNENELHCFRPLTGMVQNILYRVYMALCFRPLTGIVQHEKNWLHVWINFRPLTGMVLYDYQIKGFFKEFSPPYGDGTEMESQVDEAL